MLRKDWAGQRSCLGTTSLRVGGGSFAAWGLYSPLSKIYFYTFFSKKENFKSLDRINRNGRDRQGRDGGGVTGCKGAED